MFRTAAMASLAALVLAGGASVPAASASPGPSVGTGRNTCSLGPTANCRDIRLKWTVEYHSDLTGAKFARAKLHGADLRGSLPCSYDCENVNLTHANLSGANMSDTQMQNANLSYANLTGAWAYVSTMTGVNLSYASRSKLWLEEVNLTGSTFTGATWSNTTCPNGTVTDTGC